MISQILTILFLGLIGGVIPGPVLAATFTEILQSGFKKSIRIILWATLAETSVALFTLITLSSLGLGESFFYGISFIGSIVLMWVSWQLIKISSLDIEQRIYFSGWKVILMIVTNTALWTFWVTVCVPKAILLGESIKYGEFLFITIYEIAWFATTFGIAYIFSLFRDRLTHSKAISITFKIFALIFFYFALQMVYSATVFFLNR